MSRHVKTLKNGLIVAYGLDHALGYFIDVTEPSTEPGKEDIVIVNKSSLFNKMSNTEMVKLMVKYKCEPAHVDLVMMDLPI